MCEIEWNIIGNLSPHLMLDDVRMFYSIYVYCEILCLQISAQTWTFMTCLTIIIQFLRYNMSFLYCVIIHTKHVCIYDYKIIFFCHEWVIYSDNNIVTIYINMLTVSGVFSDCFSLGVLVPTSDFQRHWAEDLHEYDKISSIFSFLESMERSRKHGTVKVSLIMCILSILCCKNNTNNQNPIILLSYLHHSHIPHWRPIRPFVSHVWITKYSCPLSLPHMHPF